MPSWTALWSQGLRGNVWPFYSQRRALIALFYVTPVSEFQDECFPLCVNATEETTRVCNIMIDMGASRPYPDASQAGIDLIYNVDSSKRSPIPARPGPRRRYVLLPDVIRSFLN